MVRPQRLWWGSESVLRTVPLPGGPEICYVKAGQGHPVVLLHGFGTSLSIWAEQFRALADRYEVYALDLPGHGFSGKPDMEYTPQAYIGALTGFMDAVGLSRASFVGHSMGGLLSLCLAATEPGRVERLVLMSSSSPFFRPPGLLKLLERVRRRPWLWMRFLLLSELLIPMPFKLLERRGQKGTLYDAGAMGPEWNDHFYEIRRLKGFSHMVISSMINFPGLWEYENKVREIPHPVSLLWGEQDRVVPVEHGRLLQGIFPNASLETVSQCGHMVTLEKPDWATRNILLSLEA
jgi:pimeloyl-ACP methyl ester carboxylesterase